MKSVFAVLVLTAIALGASGAHAQDQSSAIATINTFKESIDNASVSGMLAVYADPDVDAPLQSANYERMSEPMSTLQASWYEKNFRIIDQEDIDDGTTVVHVRCRRANNYIKFYTKKYNGLWYIHDTEVYDLVEDD